MRIALITLALVALVFVGSIVYSISSKEWVSLFPRQTKTSPPETSLEIETLKYQIKTEEKLNELTQKIEQLTGEWARPNQTQSSTTATWESVLPVSGKFLAKIMPAYELTVTKNSWIYDLHIFDTSITYSTYGDAKNALKVIPLSIKYDTFLKNMKAIWTDVYTINETKTFPFRSFYVNPPKADTLVRIVLEIESQVLVIEIPKTKFVSFKSLLLKK